MRTSEARFALVAMLVSASSACLGGSSLPATSDAGPFVPVTQTVQVQAAYNDASFFLRVRWPSTSVAPGLAVALSSRQPASKVRDFAASGCFLGCHDSSTDMPNWLPEDGNRAMHLLPGFGGPADVWDWRAQSGNPAGQITDSLLGTDGLRPDPDGGAATLAGTGSVADDTWDVLYMRTLSAAGSADVPLIVGATYDIALALHPDGEVGRHHYVSLPVSLGLGDASAELPAVGLLGSDTPDFSDTATFAPLTVELFWPGITSFEFLVGAVVDRAGRLRSHDDVHGGAREVSSGALACRDCHRVTSDGVAAPVRNAGALERLTLRRGGVYGPAAVGVAP